MKNLHCQKTDCKLLGYDTNRLRIIIVDRFSKFKFILLPGRIREKGRIINWFNRLIGSKIFFGLLERGFKEGFLSGTILDNVCEENSFREIKNGQKFQCAS